MSRVKLITSYPITPQTTIVEKLAQMVADGKLEADYIPCEGEHPMVGITIGAALTGVRTFTATCAQGLAFGFENIVWIPGVRLPVVMAVTNRALAMPLQIGADYTDSMTVRDTGWIQLYVESNQEALDTIIQAYRIAEDQQILLPVMVCLDGFYVSHTKEMVSIPEQAGVDAYLPPYEQKHILIDPDNPMEIVGLLRFEQNMVHEMEKQKAMERAKKIISLANEEFTRLFGRRYGNGLIEEVYCDDAEVIIITMGSMSGNAYEAVTKLREQKKRVGLLRVRSFRPFPTEDIQRVIEKGDGLKSVLVFERHLSKGRGEGALLTEVKSALYDISKKPDIHGYVAGLHGVNIQVEDFLCAAEMALSEKGLVKKVEWVPQMEVKVKELIPRKIEENPARVYHPGTTTCPGCGMSLVFRYALDELGQNLVVIRTAGCQAWQSSMPGKTLLDIPLGRSVLPGGGSGATGISRGLKIKNKDARVLLFGGDGSIGDMGFLALSGAAERNEDIICILYDNEAYANTGIQRSGTTPRYASTTTSPAGSHSRGKLQPKKDLPLILAAHKIPYVATACISNLKDYRRKLAKAKSLSGFRYIHVLCPCATSWGYPAEKTIEMSRMAVRSGLFPLYEIEGGVFKLNHKPKDLIPVEVYLKAQGRYRHLTENEISAIQEDLLERWKTYLSWDEKGLVIR